MPQQVESLLRSVPTSDRVRAAAWDAVYSVRDDAEAERLLRELPLPQETKATLWDARTGAESPAKPSDKYQSVTRENLDAVLSDVGRYEQERTRPAREALPMIAGTIGGLVGNVPGAAIGGAAGEAVRQLERRAAQEPAPTTPEGAARDIAISGGVQGGIEGLGRGVTRAAAGTAKAVYRGFLKPSISQRLAPRADEIVETALREALPITRRGARTGQRVIGELRQEVDGILQRSRGSVELHDVAEQVRAFAKRKYYKPGADMRDYETALSVADRLDRSPALYNRPWQSGSVTKVAPAEANEAKRAIDASVGDAGFGVKTGAERTTEKVARRELRGALEAAEPSIAPLNARESKLIDATRAVHQAVQREANRNMVFGVPSIVSYGVGGAEYARSGDPYGAAAWALATRVGMHPAVASRAAITAHRLGRELGIAAATAARLAVHVVSEEDAQGEAQHAQE